MAQAPLKICPGCRRAYTREKRCEACAKIPRQRSVSSNRPGDPFYSCARWRKLRRMYLAAHPLCVDCERIGRTEPATEVHHVLARIDHPHLVVCLGQLGSEV